jgi:anthranilate phosphoribosyltransferase
MRHAPFLKEIARGHRGSRALTRADSAALFGDALAGRMPEAVLGGFLVALRMKGETVDELLGLADAWYAQDAARLPRTPGPTLPIVIGSYNGARRQPNLLPLFSLLLCRLGLQVLVHGVTAAAGRTTTAEIFRALDMPARASLRAAADALAADGLAFVPLTVLSPTLARFLAWRDLLGVRHLGHSFVKTLNTFDGPALCLTGITHAPYRALLHAYFVARGQDALLLRGSEGEALASLRRLPALDWLHQGEITVLPGHEEADATAPCALDASATADYTREVLAHPHRVPATLRAQLARVLIASGAARDAPAAAALLRERLGIDGVQTSA